jgi:hypothetical protein
MDFDQAISLAEGLSPQSQLRAMTAFRQTSARFDDVRTAFVAAISDEVANSAVIIDTPAKPWRFNWFGFAGLCLAALSFGAVSAWIYTLIRLMGAGQ